MKMTTTTMLNEILDQPAIVVKKLDNDHCDVFFGKGWDNWARFEIKRIKGKVFPIKQQGIALPNETFKELCQILMNAE